MILFAIDLNDVASVRMLNASEEEKQQWQSVGLAAGLGCSVVVSVLVCVVGGILLDRWLDTSPILTLIGIALALVVAGYQLYELASLSATGKSPGPVARQVAKVVPKRSSTYQYDDADNDTEDDY